MPVNVLMNDQNRLVTCVVKIVISRMIVPNNFVTDVISWVINTMNAEKTLVKSVKSVGKLDIQDSGV